MDLSKTITTSPLLNIVGIGEKTTQLLIESGITTVEELRLKSQEEIFAIVKNPISRKQIEDFLAAGAINFRPQL